MQVRRLGETRWQDVCFEWAGDRLTLSTDNSEFVEFARVQNMGRYDLLSALAKRLCSEGIEFRGCVACNRFRFSGMSQQMSNGLTGYCGLVGFRRSNATVDIDFGCGECEKVEGWPDDLSRAMKERLDLYDRDPRPTRIAAIEGCLMGLAIGDALGYPSEFRCRKDILAAFGPQGITDFVSISDPVWPPQPADDVPQHPPGTFSDDTQLSLAVAESLIAAGDSEIEDLMGQMCSRFISWHQSKENDRYPGMATMLGCKKLANGIPWRKAGNINSKGCGSAMRAAPIGLFYGENHPQLLEVARASSLPTHQHPAAIESAAAVALLVSLALSKRTPKQMYEAIMRECKPRSKDFANCLSKLPTLLDAAPEMVLAKNGLGEGWIAEEAVASALYCFWKSPMDYEQTVLTAANTDGDSDSIACIAGAISGAFNGVNAIPYRWRKHIERMDYFENTANRLWQKILSHQ